MYITHLIHSTFLIETKKAFILFDYYGKGQLPAEIKKDIYIFSSHSHEDHFDMKVFEVFADNPRAFFIMAYDIRRNFGGKIKSEYPNVQDKITYLMPNRKTDIGDVHIETLASTDAGVAYVVTHNHKVFFHAGDLHLWIWKEESDRYNERMSKAYRKRIAELRNRVIDYAFYPVDLRQEEHYDKGLKYFLDNTKTVIVFPMHYFENYSTTDKIFLNKSLSNHYEKIVRIEHVNQVFHFKHSCKE